MAMTLELLTRIYQDVEGVYTFKDVKDKARFFYKTAIEIAKREEMEDVWVQISKDWDLNVWDADKLGDGVRNGMQITLYPVTKGENGHVRTDTDFPVSLTMWS